YRAKDTELNNLLKRTNSIEGKPGYFWIKSPSFNNRGGPGMQWTVLNTDFQENLRGKTVKPSDPILRLGDKEGRWEIEMKIPQEHIGQVLNAFAYLKTDELEVDILVRSDPTHIYKGRLHRSRIAGEATPQREEQDPEPVVTTYVRIEGDDIPEAQRVPRDLLT